MLVPIKSFAAFACLSLAVLPVAADVLAQAEKPLPPMALTVESTGEANVLSWQPPLASPSAPVEAYHVYRIVEGARESLGSVSATTTSFVDAGIDPDAFYAYFVTASSVKGESGPSNFAFPQYPRCLDIVVIGEDVEVDEDCALSNYPPPRGPVEIIFHD